MSTRNIQHIICLLSPPVYGSILQEGCTESPFVTSFAQSLLEPDVTRPEGGLLHDEWIKIKQQMSENGSVRDVARAWGVEEQVLRTWLREYEPRRYARAYFDYLLLQYSESNGDEVRAAVSQSLLAHAIEAYQSELASVVDVYANPETFATFRRLRLAETMFRQRSEPLEKRLARCAVNAQPSPQRRAGNKAQSAGGAGSAVSNYNIIPESQEESYAPQWLQNPKGENNPDWVTSTLKDGDGIEAREATHCDDLAFDKMWNAREFNELIEPVDVFLAEQQPGTDREVLTPVSQTDYVREQCESIEFIDSGWCVSDDESVAGQASYTRPSCKQADTGRKAWGANPQDCTNWDMPKLETSVVNKQPGAWQPVGHAASVSSEDMGF